MHDRHKQKKYNYLYVNIFFFAHNPSKVKSEDPARTFKPTKHLIKSLFHLLKRITFFSLHTKEPESFQRQTRAKSKSKYTTIPFCKFCTMAKWKESFQRTKAKCESLLFLFVRLHIIACVYKRLYLARQIGSDYSA